MFKFTTGQAVLGASGRLGIVTEDVRKSGPNKGKVAVIFAGSMWEVSQSPDDLTPISISGVGALDVIAFTRYEEYESKSSL